MASNRTKPIIPSIFCVLLTISQCFVRTDSQSLVSTVCSKTPEPGYCQRCIDSYPNNRKETIKDLAGTTIDCVKNESLVVQNILDQYNRATHLEEIRKCLVIFSVGIKNILTSVQDYFVKQQYENAGLNLDSAKSVYLECSNLLVRSRRSIPPDLATAAYSFGVYDDVAKNVVNQIK